MFQKLYNEIWTITLSLFTRNQRSNHIHRYTVIISRSQEFTILELCQCHQFQGYLKTEKNSLILSLQLYIFFYYYHSQGCKKLENRIFHSFSTLSFNNILILNLDFFKFYCLCFKAAVPTLPTNHFLYKMSNRK